MWYSFAAKQHNRSKGQVQVGSVSGSWRATLELLVILLNLNTNTLGHTANAGAAMLKATRQLNKRYLAMNENETPPLR